MLPRIDNDGLLARRFATALASITFAVVGQIAAASTPEIIRVYDVPQPRIAEVVKLGDFWGPGREQDRTYLVMAVDDQARQSIEKLGFDVEIDQERTASAERFLSVDREQWRLTGQPGIPGYPCYRTVEETHGDLAALAVARPELASWQSIGQTWRSENGQPGGDDINVLVLASEASPHDRAPMLLMAAQHARELATAETATRFAEWLVENYDDNATARWLLDHREIHIVAQQNPDGRREVEAGEIWWRKNGNQNACPGGTPGVDLNRNSTHFWNEFSSGNACSETYRGNSPASEPETRAVQNYMEQVFDQYWSGGNEQVPDDAQGLFISLHSFGELILFPWEGTDAGASNNAPNHNQLAWLGRKFGFFTGYDVGRAILSPAGGTMTDQAHGEFGVASYTFEIGTSFHQSCNYFEHTMWPGLLQSLIYAAKAARRPYQAPSGPDVVNITLEYAHTAGIVRVAGVADDNRYDRGGVTEAPRANPVTEPIEIRASYDTPPDQAPDPLVVSLPGDSSNQVFEFEITPPTAPGPRRRLLFLQASDRQGRTGVPSAIWVETGQIHGDRFEQSP
jgi:hypothetical protein